MEQNKKTGVLLISLGTPDSLRVRDVRRFLAQFLSDSHVISLNKWFWLPILYGPVLTFRPKKTAHAYSLIWNREADESPLRTVAREQAEKLKNRLHSETILVDWAFRYGSPCMESKIHSLKERGCDRILLFALYPQNSETSTGSAYDHAFNIIGAMRDQPEIRTIRSYHDNEIYIKAVKSSIEDSLGSLDWEPEVILSSYHSIPKPYSDAGDPYLGHVMRSHELLKQAAGARGSKMDISFQSRFGLQEWLRPYSDDKVRELASSGVKKLVIVSPGFSADCLETLEEINMQLRDIFMQSGGTHFHYVPCLNASEPGIDVFEAIIREHLWQSPHAR